MTATDPQRSPAPGSVVNHTNPTDWDDLVARLGGQPFQAWAWGELKERFGWQPFRLSAADGSSAAQLLIRRYRGLAVAYVPRGPVVARDGSVDPQLIEAIVRLARSHRAAFVRFEPDLLEDDPRAADFARILKGAGLRTSERTLQPRSTIRLSLAPTGDELLAGLSKGHRADLRRAERDGVTVRIGSAESDVETLHQMLAAVQRRKAFGFHSAGYFRALMRSFGASARLFIAEREGAPIGASLDLAWGEHGIYLAAGSSSDGLEHRAAHLLQWHAINWAKERGALTWDMWGIADARGQLEIAAANGEDRGSPNMARLEQAAKRDPLDGVYRFKKGWGGEVVRTVPAYDRVFIRPAYWLWQWRRGEA